MLFSYFPFFSFIAYVLGKHSGDSTLKATDWFPFLPGHGPSSTDKPVAGSVWDSGLGL